MSHSIEPSPVQHHPHGVLQTLKIWFDDRLLPYPAHELKLDRGEVDELRDMVTSLETIPPPPVPLEPRDQLVWIEGPVDDCEDLSTASPRD